MSTCKDCLNKDVCPNSYQLEMCKYPSENCVFFKDCSKFVYLPFKRGDKVWVDTSAFSNTENEGVFEYEFTYLHIFLGNIYNDISVVLCRNKHRIEFSNLEELKECIGKSIFYTLEEAEQALKEREKNEKNIKN